MVILGLLEGLEENYKTFNRKQEERDNFIAMNSPWLCYMSLILIPVEMKNLTFFQVIIEIQTEHYCLVESAGDTATIFGSHLRSTLLKIFLQ